MSRVSQAYSQVSKAWIMPGFRIIDRMALGQESLSSWDVETRSSELNRYSIEAKEQIRMVTDQASLVLRTSSFNVLTV
jgi:hypothetical protein